MKHPGCPPQNGRRRRAASVLPVIILISSLCLCAVIPGLLIRPRVDAIPVNLRSSLRADYSADRRNLSFSNIDLGLVQDYWLDNNLSPTEAAQRLSTLTALLQTPVPTVTALPGQTRPQPTPALPSPTAVEEQAASPSPTSTILPSATPLATASPTLPPSLTPTPPPSPTASAMPLPSPTASNTAAPALLPSPTPTEAAPHLRTLPSHPTPTASFMPRPSATPPPTSTPLPTVTPPPTSTPLPAAELPPPAAPAPPVAAPPIITVPAGELSVRPLCSDNPDVERRWNITNTGAAEVTFTWELLGQGDSGTGTVGANASVMLSTGAKTGTTVIRISAPGYRSVTAVNHGELCPPSFVLPPPELPTQEPLPPEPSPTGLPAPPLEPTATAAPTQTPEPTVTAAPTQTPEPTATPG